MRISKIQAKMSGSQLITEMTGYSEESRNGLYTHGVQKGNNPGMRATSFPTSEFNNTSPMDEQMQERIEMVAKSGGTGATPFGQLTVTERELDWLAKKRETAEAANLDAWIGQTYNVDDIATRAWLQRTYPQYYERREEEMVRRSKFALRVSLLALRGPRNRKDLILDWGLKTGRIKLEKGWNVIGKHLTGEDVFEPAKAQKRYRNGLFSINRYQTDAERKANATADWNPMRTNGRGESQIENPFPGGAVSGPRYPNFMQGVIDQAKGI